MIFCLSSKKVNDITGKMCIKKTLKIILMNQNILLLFKNDQNIYYEKCLIWNLNKCAGLHKIHKNKIFKPAINFKILRIFKSEELG